MSAYRIIAFPAETLPEQYRAMVFKKFLFSLRYSNRFFRLIDKDSYFKHYEQYIKMLMTRPQAQVKLAVLDDDYDVVLGWALIEPDVLHYVYVNRENREIGIAKALLQNQFSEVTHLTNMGLKLWSTKLPHVIFNPFR